jgi:hypothetical protein
VTILSVSNGIFLVPGIQLRARKLVPQWLGDFILWLFFHRLDTYNKIEISGLSVSVPARAKEKGL